MWMNVDVKGHQDPKINDSIYYPFSEPLVTLGVRPRIIVHLPGRTMVAHLKPSEDIHTQHG